MSSDKSLIRRVLIVAACYAVRGTFGKVSRLAERRVDCSLLRRFVGENVAVKHRLNQTTANVRWRGTLAGRPSEAQRAQKGCGVVKNLNPSNTAARSSSVALGNTNAFKSSLPSGNEPTSPKLTSGHARPVVALPDQVVRQQD